MSDYVNAGRSKPRRKLVLWPYALGIAVFVVGTSVVRVRSRLTDWLGRISYSIYLFHPVVFMALLWGLQRFPATSWWRSQHLGIYLLVNALLTAALATLVFHCVERPGIEFGRRLARRWVARRTHAPLEAAAAPTAMASARPGRF